MDFNEYQRKTREFAIYTSHLYPCLGLSEETGELLGKIAKALRDGVTNPEAHKADVKKEAGDVLWMLARLLDDMNIALADVAAMNIEKLQDRKQRDVLRGSGDNR